VDLRVGVVGGRSSCGRKADTMRRDAMKKPW